MPGRLKLRALTVRKLHSDDYEWLRRQAAAHGRSMEAEVRALLIAAKRQSHEAQPTSEVRVRSGYDAGRRPTRATRVRQGKVKRESEKLPVEEVIARLQALFADIKPKRKGKLLSEEFMEERRRMWGED